MFAAPGGSPAIQEYLSLFLTEVSRGLLASGEWSKCLYSPGQAIRSLSAQGRDSLV